MPKAKTLPKIKPVKAWGMMGFDVDGEWVLRPIATQAKPPSWFGVTKAVRVEIRVVQPKRKGRK